MQAEKRKISVWVPADLYDSVLQVGYTSPTQAVVQGFELLVKSQSEESPEAIRGQMQVIRRQMQAEIESLESDVERLTVAIQEAPSPLELIELRARCQEIEKHNETLKKELDRAGQDKDVIQNLYNNYMLQMQFLITQKAIAPPSSINEDQPGSKPVVEPTPGQAEKKEHAGEPTTSGEYEKVCPYCNKQFFTDTSTQIFCCKKNQNNDANKRAREKKKAEKGAP